MKFVRSHQLLAVAAIWGAPVFAQLNCAGPNGNIFNLEPRSNAVVQAAKSIAFLPGAGSGGGDLVVGTATDMRGIAATNDEFYVERSSTNCAADFEGGLPQIENILGVFAGNGTPIAVADPARSAFFVVDLRFGGADQNGIGIVRSDAATLLSSSSCPSGTQSQGSAGCWTVGAVTNVTSLNAFLDSPHIAIDQRATGAGAGDVYTVVSERSANGSSNSISLTACTNSTLNCGASIVISGSDQEADFPYVQVRTDGGITVSYRNTTFPKVNPEDIKFVTCTPKGAPNAPSCTAPVLITTEDNPVFASLPGDVPMEIDLYPRHANRLESDGHTVTTFLVYDRCDAAIIQQAGLGSPFCPKSDVVFTTSTDGGATWGPTNKISTAVGQQFFSSIALDAGTGTMNVAYYSTENDFFQQRPQVFLAQFLPGTTTPAAPHLLTTGTGDVQATSPLTVLLQPVGFGDRLGLAAAAGTAYVGFTWNSVFGSYAGVSSADMNNHVTRFSY